MPRVLQRFLSISTFSFLICDEVVVWQHDAKTWFICFVTFFFLFLFFFFSFLFFFFFWWKLFRCSDFGVLIRQQKERWFSPCLVSLLYLASHAFLTMTSRNPHCWHPHTFNSGTCLFFLIFRKIKIFIWKSKSVKTFVNFVSSSVLCWICFSLFFSLFFDISSIWNINVTVC